MTRVNDGRGARAGQPKPSRAQIERREARTVQLTNQGYWADQIAQSMIPPVSEATISKDRLHRRDELTRSTMGRHGPRLRPPPEPFEWMTGPPPPPPPPPHRITGPLPRLEGLLDWLKSNNARNLLAFNVAEAGRLGDAEYLQQLREVLGELSGYLDDLASISVSEEARKAAEQTEARDDLKAPPPRGWNGSAERWNGSASGEKPMPAFGRGTIPASVHAALWQEWWAGHDILDPKVLTRVAVRERRGRDINPARVRRAAAELLAVLKPPA